MVITGAQEIPEIQALKSSSSQLLSGVQKPCQVFLVYGLKDKSIVFLGLMSFCSVHSSLLQEVSDQCGSHKLINLLTPSLHSQGQCINPRAE